MATERLQKILARGGFASRRAAEKLIAEGRVRVNGRVVTELGSKADPYKDRVEVNGERVVADKAVYVVLHKPRGVVTTMNDPEGRQSVAEILAPIGTRIYPVGRLDFATSGVLLATNDGDFAEGMMHPKKSVPKTYIVKAHGTMQPEDLERWRKGIRLEDGMTLPAEAKLIRHETDKTWFELTICEGRNQQIRRMGDASGFPVRRLARVSFAGITSEGLRPGAWRYLTPDELIVLKKEYGVPKRIVDAEMRPTGRTRPRREGARPAARAAKSARGRREEHPRAGAPREETSRARPGDRRDEAPRAGKRRQDMPRKPRDEAPRAGKRRDEAPRTGGRRAGRSAPRAEKPPAESPRYGGGAPGRRGYEVKEDWGGGAGRGRSGRDRAEADAGASGVRRGSSSGASRSDMPRGDVGGRGGQSRTTGTGGGIGASGNGDYRVGGKPRRGR